MKTLAITAAAAVLAVSTLSAPAFAKGGASEEQRAELKAAIAEARANQADNGPSFFERLFGAEPSVANGNQTGQQTTN